MNTLGSSYYQNLSAKSECRSKFTQDVYHAQNGFKQVQKTSNNKILRPIPIHANKNHCAFNDTKSSEVDSDVVEMQTKSQIEFINYLLNTEQCLKNQELQKAISAIKSNRNPNLEILIPVTMVNNSIVVESKFKPVIEFNQASAPQN